MTNMIHPNSSMPRHAVMAIPVKLLILPEGAVAFLYNLFSLLN